MDTMKTTLMSVMTSMALIAGLAVSPAALASNSSDVTKSLAGATALELPAKSAALVAKAAAADKHDLTVAVVKAAIGLNPSAAVAIVSTVAHENPAMAPLAAVTAATLQHQRIAQFARAAAAGAPSEAAKIVAALIKEFPQDYGAIAIAAAQGAPEAGREILAVVADYVPALQSAVNGTVAKFAANNGNIPVQAVLSQSYNQALASGGVTRTTMPSTLLGQVSDQTVVAGGTVSAHGSAVLPTTPGLTRGPSVSPPVLGPPYQPFPNPPTVIGPGQITPQAPGGNNYSSP